MPTKVTFKGSPLTIEGTELKVGATVPSFTLTGTDMADLSSDILKGKASVISVVPSLDTPVCSLQTKRFNKEIGDLGKDVVVLTVSMDLPFAQKRWCGAEGAEHVVTASDYKHRAFGQKFGAWIKEWGLLARAVFVADKSGKITYVEYVPEVSSEPNYDNALKAVKALT